MGNTQKLGTLVNGLSVDASGNVTLPATIYIGSSTSSRIDIASNIIRGFYSTESTPRFAIGRDVFANGQAGVSFGAGTSYAGIGVNTTGNGGGNVLYFSLNNQLSTGLDSSIYGTMSTSGFSYTTPSSTSNVLNITTNASWTSGYLDHSAFMAPNMTGGALSLGFGKGNASYNLGKIVFNYSGNQSSSNSIGLGFYNYDNKLVIRGDGNIIVNGGVLQVSNGTTYTRNALQSSYFGYNGVYRTLIIGSSGTDYTTTGTTLAFNVDVSSNTNGSFSGNGSEYIWRNTGSFITPNAANNAYNNLFGWNSSGQITFYNNFALNDQQLRTRYNSDPNHALVHNQPIDGPFLYGYQGAALGYSSSGNYLKVIWTSTTNAYNYNNSTTWQQTSDIKVKDNIRPIGQALDKICSLNPSHFEYKGKEGITKTGFIAQEFEQVFPGHVSEIKPLDEYKEYFEEGEMMKTIDPDLIPYLVQAIKELKAEIEILKNK